jgi:cell division transport system permease protein
MFNREDSLRLLPEGRESAGLLPWVIAVMVYLCALAIAGGAGLRSAAGSWTADLASTITVQVSATDPAERDRQAGLVAQALTTEPGVVRAVPLGQADTNKLLEPWLGTGNVTADLPIPKLIDVTLDPNNKPDMAALAARLKAVAPASSIDTHQQWLGQLSTFTRSVEWIANLVVVLVALATMAIVAFGTRAGLATHKPTIEILHLMGAEDQMIAQEFQWKYLWHGLKGGLLGLAAAAATIGLLAWLASRMTQGLMGSVDLPWGAYLILALLPVLAGVMTMITARQTVLRALKEFL